jgi:hypothetical protein
MRPICHPQLKSDPTEDASPELHKLSSCPSLEQLPMLLRQEWMPWFSYVRYRDTTPSRRLNTVFVSTRSSNGSNAPRRS